MKNTENARLRRSTRCAARRPHRGQVACASPRFRDEFLKPKMTSNHVETILSADGADLRVASPEWTLFDLARYQDRVEAMVALDGAYRMGPGYDPRYSLPRLLDRYPGLRGNRIALERCAGVEPMTESAMETRLRMFLVDLGLTGFVVQFDVPGLPYRADFAFPDRKVLVEYDGGGPAPPPSTLATPAARTACARPAGRRSS